MSRFLSCIGALLLAVSIDGGRDTRAGADVLPAFVSAQPVWIEGRETEKNLTVGFRTAFDAPAGSPAVLRITASSAYRAFLNGVFVGYGPARGPHGYYRVDEWDLRDRLSGKSNLLAIEVAGYNANSYYLLDQPSFLQAEVVSGRQILASTGGKGAAMNASVLDHRVQKVQRYSFQRPFIEIYRMTPESDRWRTDAAAAIPAVSLKVQAPKTLLARRAPYPAFAQRPALSEIAAGTIETGHLPAKPWRDRSLTGVGPKFAGYAESELSEVVSQDLQKLKYTKTGDGTGPLAAGTPFELEPNSWRTVDFGTNLSGFLRARIHAERKTKLYLMFDEILSDGEVDFRRLGCVNAVTCDLAPGDYELESFEPYTMRYLRLAATQGVCQIRDVGLREYVNPDSDRAVFRSQDASLNRIFEAARETFRQNAVDVFMDCPSRERAGWLCDSFFTARVAFDLCGNLDVETPFLENFALPASFAHQPDGMLPMCYPADHNDGVFIPNWAMWFVLQLEEYAQRGGDRRLVESLRPRVMKLLSYLATFRNSDGLLEKLPSWVFIEWSKANSFTQDVNYPSNMLYAGALDAAGRIYGRQDLRRAAGQVRQVVRKQSFDGEFFVDNAVRKDGKLEVTRNRTEVCQYFAFFFGIVGRESKPELWSKLQSAFGPDRKGGERFPEIHPANAFVGNYLRLELLSRYGQTEQIVAETKGYFLKMAERTGTLWENDDPSASCNHGFASHVAHLLLRDVLGVESVDPLNMKVTLHLPNISLTQCEGKIPVGSGFVDLRWKREGQAIRYSLSLPRGYTAVIRPTMGLDVVQSR